MRSPSRGQALCHPSAYDSQRSLYTEMEYFVPVDEAAALVADLRAFHESVQPAVEQLCAPPNCSLFAGIRYVAADENWMSMMYGRDIAVLSQIVIGTPSMSGPPEVITLLDRGLERLALARSGRPHWGKWHEAAASELRPAYPHFDDFVALRARLDPHGLFVNDWLQTQLGLSTRVQ